MRKYVVLALALMVGTFSFAQKKELKIAQKAIKNSNYSEAKTALSSAEALMSSMDEKSKSLFYLLKSKSLYKGGSCTDNDIDNALDAISKVSLPAHSQEASELKQLILANILKKGNSALQAKDLANSSTYFEKAYRISSKDTIYLYYSASTAVNSGEYDRAIDLYSELKELKYTGIEKKFYAVNKETQEKENFDSKTLRDLSVRSGTHSSPTEEMTKSKLAEIVKNLALIYVQQDKNDLALEAINEAKKENPDDMNLLLSEASVYHKMGNNDKFKEILEIATVKDPKNAELQYNLGVIAADSGDTEAAKKYYSRAVEINPEYVNAFINLAALTLDQEQAIVEEMNGLGSSAADDKKYDELKAKRQQLYFEAIPYLESALKVEPNSLQAAKTLMNIYSAVDNMEKYNEIKAKVEAIEAGN